MAHKPIDPRGDRIDKLQEGLYSRGGQDITRSEKTAFSNHETLVKNGWKEDDTLSKVMTEDHEEKKKMSFFTKVFLASIIFFLVAAGIAAYVLSGGFNVISSKNVDISVQGIIAVAAGEELNLDIIVSNSNNAALEQGEMFIEYPPGTKMPSDLTKDLTREKILIDNIPAGASIVRTVKAVVFGEKESVQQIKITLDYKARGSNAAFSKEKTYDITIKSSPVIMEVTYPKEVNAGQDISVKIDLTSNSAVPIRNLLVRTEYPFGFNFQNSSPKATAGNNVWRIGDLNPNEKRSITISGKIEGQNEEERTIKFNTGIASATDENQIGIGFIALAKSISIKKPFITLSMKLNQSEDKEYLTKIGGQIRGSISWVNNLPVTINDAEIKVKFSGDIINREIVGVFNGGFYRSSDNTITWDRNSLPELRSIDPGDSRSVNFDITLVPSSPALVNNGRNLQSVMDVSVKGTRVSENSNPETVSALFSRVIKVATNLDLNSRSLYTSGPFRNTGPIPPRAENPTSYTIVWTFSNTFNDVTGARVTATLPPHMTWLGNKSPNNENVTYNETNRTIIWNAGEVKAASGFASAPREVYFQVSLNPSLNQVGTVPVLVENIQVVGVDRFTGKEVTATKPSLTTRISTDPGYLLGNETVAR